MQTTRLIKRNNIINDESVKEDTIIAKVPKNGFPSINREVVKKWINEYQGKPMTDARSAFSALFAQPL